MPFNGSGSFSIPNSFTPGTTIASSQVNQNFTDIAAGLSNVLPRDGQAAMTAPLRIVDGELATPAIAFAADPNTGFRRRGTDQMAWTAGGVDRMSNDAAGNMQVAKKLNAIEGLQVNGEDVTVVPFGTPLIWPFPTIPTGFFLLNGQAVSRIGNPKLFARYQTMYGAGDGSTTFNLPNYQDFFLRGFSPTGTDAASRTDRGDGTTGANVGTKQEDAFESHTHTANVTDPGHGHTGSSNKNGLVSGNGIGSGGEARMDPQTITINNSPTGITVANVATGGTETRPKNITVNFIVQAG